MATSIDHNEHPTWVKPRGRDESYAAMDDYLDIGDPFEGHPLPRGVI